MTAGDDCLGVGNDATVVQEDIDVILGRQQGADVALQHEVRLAGALDGLGDVGIGGVDDIADLPQIACCQSGSASMYASTRGSAAWTICAHYTDRIAALSRT